MNQVPPVGGNELAAELLLILLLLSFSLFLVVRKICAWAKRRPQLRVGGGGDDERREDLSQTGRQDADRRRCHVPLAARSWLKEAPVLKDKQRSRAGWGGKRGSAVSALISSWKWRRTRQSRSRELAGSAATRRRHRLSSGLKKLDLKGVQTNLLKMFWSVQSFKRDNK